MLNILLYLFEHYLLFEHVTPQTINSSLSVQENEEPSDHRFNLFDLACHWLSFVGDQARDLTHYQATRILSPLEKRSLTIEAEQLLYELTQTNLITSTALERILAVCISHRGIQINEARLAYIILFVMLNTEQSTHNLCAIATAENIYQQTIHRVIH